MHWYLKVWKSFFEFEGRARRKEYWTFSLIHWIVLVLLILAGELNTLFYIVYFLYAAAGFIPGLAVTVRRLHDTDRSGLWFFIVFIPIIGGIWLFVLTVLEGDYGENEFGPDPKEHTEAA
ncbi:hypothetical protein CR205_02605 [Alteribacter lacisalsi]|uniref:DUF805 domain-containing protein n=1 Tax=Alteribacter lacisalsi TaxID=2045244 RepID=A0A2W0HJ30_9BACI|nr:DUF805 domain-containing protein [Alteribacter lacisalsi]PYZ97505.1 hypothetical protein CR205_02605 [Alteribacter lacisalsi]